MIKKINMDPRITTFVAVAIATTTTWCCHKLLKEKELLKDKYEEAKVRAHLSPLPRTAYIYIFGEK